MFPLVVSPLKMKISWQEDNVSTRIDFEAREDRHVFFNTLPGDYSPIVYVEPSRIGNCADIFSEAMISPCHCALIYPCLKHNFLERLTRNPGFRADFVSI